MNKTIVNIYVNGNNQNLIKVYAKNGNFEQWLKDHMTVIADEEVLNFHDISGNHYVVPDQVLKNSIFGWRDEKW